MEEPGTIHNTFVIERTLAKAPDQVFAAFSDPTKKKRWYAEGRGHELIAYELDFRQGGRERLEIRMGANTPFPGAAVGYDMEIADIVPNQRIVIAQSMDFRGRRVSVALITFELMAADGGGTTLICTHQAAFFEGADGPAIREQGWRALFDRLAEFLQ
ncbi:MAG TPA: SRPBCC domain-containing protein [Caulobacterales bacterium]|nr:SRPBCC domain-containing protein [Caulobacterales bacterium]